MRKYIAIGLLSLSSLGGCYAGGGYCYGPRYGYARPVGYYGRPGLVRPFFARAPRVFVRR